MAGAGLILAGISLWWLVPRGEPTLRGEVAELSAVPVNVRYAAPDLSLRDLSGQQQDLTDYRGQVVLVNLWATWCPPCRAEMPALQQFHEQHQNDGFTVIAINDGESADVVRNFVQARLLTFPIWLDPHYTATEVAFRSRNLPSSYVIDRGGVVRFTWVGAIDRENLEEFIAPLIEE